MSTFICYNRAMRFIQKMRPLFSALILTFAASFMFFIFEPITLYANNTNDFWFDIYDILPLLLAAFVATFLVLFLICVEVYIICAKIIEKVNLYYYFIAILGCIFLITYIQGNFLSGALPGLDGTPFNWRSYPIESIISVSLWFIAFFVLYISLQKFGIDKFFKFIPWATGAIFLMLFISLISTIATSHDTLFKNKNISIATYDHYNEASTDRNFFIFLVDAVDSQNFNNLMKDNQKYYETFKDFTYFPDTISLYPYTKYSLPFIITQEPYHLETDFNEYSENAYANSSLFNELYSSGYKMSFYNYDFLANGDTAERFANMSLPSTINPKIFYKELLRYDLFKYLPYPLKNKVHIENVNFQNTSQNNELNVFAWDNVKNYQIYTTEPIDTVDDKVFQFVHLEGGHSPHNMDGDLNPVDPNVGTYLQKLPAAFKVIDAYLNRLKQYGVYDNSSIIIMSDHGYGDTNIEDWTWDSALKRFNPILYIKGVDETHDQMQVSDKPISHIDLNQAYTDLINGKSSAELFSDISYPRTRPLITYLDSAHPNYLKEYETSGPAWAESQYTPTGTTYGTTPEE